MCNKISDTEALERIAAALESMPDWPRAVFVRHRFDDADYSTIAAELRISVKLVERHFATAMLHLHRAVFEDDQP
ncbi:sigma-70 region 4 domain-containing protein [Sphingomonas sp. RT2P30]|uniref:RNA polymerase sigma factor n=1 Tax=Parasphingomonas halimpatiens TaxID=3096162 RepID=UPI002FC5F298